jgi:hypothetical protein
MDHINILTFYLYRAAIHERMAAAGGDIGDDDLGTGYFQRVVKVRSHRNRLLLEILTSYHPYDFCLFGTPLVTLDLYASVYTQEARMCGT